MSKKEAQNNSEPFIETIEKVLFWWERHGLDRLAITEPTLAAFKRQELPEQMRTAVKKRVGRKTRARIDRYFKDTRSQRVLWPEDDQAIYNFPAMAFVISGSADFHVADYLIECPANHFLLFRDDVPRPQGNRAHLNDNGVTQRQCDVLWFFLPPGFNSIISYICHSRGHKHWSDGYHIVQHPSVLRTFEVFMTEVQGKNGDNARISYNSYQTFLLLFLRELKRGNFLNTQPPQETIADTTAIGRAKTYIEAHLHQPLTTAHVAEKVYMSRRSFVDHFKDETGQTFHEYLTRKRMERARQLLGTGNWPIQAIAQRVGLKPTRFCAQFKVHFGITPSSYQQEQHRSAQKR